MADKVQVKDAETNSVLQLGEYFLHIFVEETSSLAAQDDEDTVDVVIEVEAFDKKKHTETRKGIGYGTAAFYGEHFFFDQEFKTRSVLDSQILRVTVFDAGIFRRKVGSIDISIPSIYYEENHTINHRWFMLSNLQENYQQIMGYIKLSLNLVQSNQKRSILVAEKPEEKMTGESIRGLSIPPQFKLERKQVKVQIFTADRLVEMDSSLFQGSGSDPYVKLYLGGTEIKTEVIKKSKKSANFYETLYITMIYPTFIDQMSLSLKDQDGKFQDNEYFGTTTFQILDIKRGKYAKPFWAYIYGGHSDVKDKDVKDSMNKFPELASRFKGAIYLSIEMIDAINQGNFKEKIRSEQVVRPPPMSKFKICLEMYSVHNIHYIDESENGGHYINVDWGGKMTTSTKCSLNCGMLEYYQYMELEESFSCTSLDELPDIVISVVRSSKDRHVSYCRLKPKDFASSMLITDKYMMLNIDRAISKLQDDGAGIIHLKMGVDRMDKWQPMSLAKFDKNLVRPKANPVVIALNIFQAKELPSGDDDGSADPVVVAYHYGTLARSTIFRKTLNPIWNERILIPTYIVGSFIPPLIINVHDYDVKLVGKAEYEFLGSTHMFLNQFNQAQDYAKIPEPTWHNLKYSEDSKMGKISLSATIINASERADNLRPRVVKMNQQLVDHSIKIRILGLRNLQSSGLIPVKKPYIKINTSSLMERSINEQDIPYTDLTTVPKSGGDNPNIGDVMK